MTEPASSTGPGTEQRLARALLGAPLSLDLAAAATALGASPEELASLWRALGFADVGPGQAFAITDVEAIGMLLGFVRTGMLDDASAIDLLRSIAQTTSRLADWQVETLARAVAPLPPGTTPRRRSDHLAGQAAPGPGGPDAPDQLELPDEAGSGELWPVESAGELVAARVEQSLTTLERLLTHVWRRQLFAVVARMARDPDSRPGTVQCVGFADIAGFTRIARSATPVDLSALVTDFETGSADIVASAGARLIKTVGDEVMFAADEPVAAAEVAVRLHRRHAAGSGRPALRIGLATGEPVMQMGDLYGDPVNLASRLTAAARPGTTLVDSHTAAALQAQAAADVAADAPGRTRSGAFRLRALAPRRFRGFGVMRTYSLGPRA